MKNKNPEKKFLHFPVIISITFVLFGIGILSIFGIYSYKIIYQLKEKLPIEIFLKDSINKKELESLSKLIKSLDYIKTFKYINKKEALKIAEKELGIKKEDLLENEIFPASIKITLKSKDINLNELNHFVGKIQANPNVEDVKHFKNLLEKVYSNIKKSIFWIGTFSLLFLFIAILFIYNTLVLCFHSKKNTIDQMKLIGARKRFIYRPFIKQSFYWSFIASSLSFLGLSFLFYFLNKKLNLDFLSFKRNYINIGILFLEIFLLGIFISIGSTYFIIRKFLRRKILT